MNLSGRDIRYNGMLMAKFLGSKLRYDQDNILPGEFGYYIDGIPKIDGREDGWHDVNDMHFHDSFDWQMAVVEKIESFGLPVEIEGKYCWIKNLGVENDDLPWLKDCPDFFLDESIEIDSKKTAVYTVLLNFINWYNRNA